jgi:CheY-like chemotaxis protein
VSGPHAPSPAAPDTVLVVDDEVIARMVISEYLRDCGYKVIEAADVAEALHILKQVEIDIAVVLCGIGNAGAAGGFALAQWLRSNRPGVEIILAGNHARAANAAGELCEDGPKLSKPYDPQLVIDRIKRLLAARANLKK